MTGRLAVVACVVSLLSLSSLHAAADIAPDCRYGGNGAACVVKSCERQQDCVDPVRAARAEEAAASDNIVMQALNSYEPPQCIEESLCLVEMQDVGASWSAGACGPDLACGQGRCVPGRYCVQPKRTSSRFAEGIAEAAAPEPRSPRWFGAFSLLFTLVAGSLAWTMYRKRRQDRS